MSTPFAYLALIVGTVAAVRSTWSPCGLSMLSTLTPVAERAKGHRYGATCAWFVMGATAGGLALGGLVAMLAAVVAGLGPSSAAVGSVALAAALVALVSDTGLAGVRVPVHHRQVNERWLDTYRPWVYGGGFGFQIGTGLATYITTAAVYLFVVLGALTGDPAIALALGASFGLVRGLAVLLTRRVTDPVGLLGFHRRFAALLPRAQRAALAVVALVAVVSAVVAWPVSGVVAAGAVVVTASARLAVRPGRRPGTPIPGGPTSRVQVPADPGASVPVA